MRHGGPVQFISDIICEAERSHEGAGPNLMSNESYLAKVS